MSDRSPACPHITNLFNRLLCGVAIALLTLKSAAAIGVDSQCAIWGKYRDTSFFKDWQVSIDKAAAYKDGLATAQARIADIQGLASTNINAGTAIVILKGLDTTGQAIADLAQIGAGVDAVKSATTITLDGVKDATDIFSDGFDSDRVLYNWTTTTAEKQLKELAVRRSPLVGGLISAAYDTAKGIIQATNLANSMTSLNTSLQNQITSIATSISNYSSEYQSLSSRTAVLDQFKETMDAQCGSKTVSTIRECAARVQGISNSSDTDAIKDLRWIKDNCTTSDYRDAIAARAAGGLASQRNTNLRQQSAASASSAKSLEAASNHILGAYLAASQSSTARAGTPGSRSPACQRANDVAIGRIQPASQGASACDAARSQLALCQSLMQAISTCPQLDPGGSLQSQCREQMNAARQIITNICVTPSAAH